MFTKVARTPEVTRSPLAPENWVTCPFFTSCPSFLFRPPHRTLYIEHPSNRPQHPQCASTTPHATPAPGRKSASCSAAPCTTPSLPTATTSTNTSTSTSTSTSSSRVRSRASHTYVSAYSAQASVDYAPSQGWKLAHAWSIRQGRASFGRPRQMHSLRRASTGMRRLGSTVGRAIGA